MSAMNKYTSDEMTGELIQLASAFVAVANEAGLDAGELLMSFVGEEATAEQVAIAVQYAQLNRA